VVELLDRTAGETLQDRWATVEEEHWIAWDAGKDRLVPVRQRARNAGEPAGQLAARELEIQRIRSALRRAGDLDDDVAAAIEVA
jgi:hypothetical protein